MVKRMQFVGFRIQPELMKRVKQRAKERQMGDSELIRIALTFYLDEDPNILFRRRRNVRKVGEKVGA